MKLRIASLAVFCAYMLSGCSGKSSADGGNSSPLLTSANVETSDSTASAESSVPDPTGADCVVKIDGAGGSVSGNGAKVQNGVVSITQAGTYKLAGKSDNCCVKVNAGDNDEITLVLDGVALHSESGSVIDCESAGALTLYLESGSENSLSDSESYPDGETDAAVFVRSDLKISGAGKLSVNSVHGDAIKCKDNLAVFDGVLDVVSADDGIVGKDGVYLCGGKISVNADGDGLKSTNDTDPDKGSIYIKGGELAVTSGADAVQAERGLIIKGGKITAQAGGGITEIPENQTAWDFDLNNSDTSQKGLKAGGNIKISGGELAINSADDSVHSNGSITISNAVLELTSGDDAVHADENITILSGEINIPQSYEGIEGRSIDIDGGNITLTATDDGLNAAGGDNANVFGFGQAVDDYYVSISGGNITVSAEGDGVDSNGTIAQSGGVLTVFGPTNSGNGALDYDLSYVLSGGTLIAVGASGMAKAPSTLSQPCLSINSEVPAESRIEVRGEGNVILDAVTPKPAQSLILSCEEMAVGEEYGIYINGELAVSVTAEDGVSGNGVQDGMHGVTLFGRRN